MLVRALPSRFRLHCNGLRCDDDAPPPRTTLSLESHAFRSCHRGVPVLMFAVQYEYPTIVRLLLEHGANPSFRCEPEP